MHRTGQASAHWPDVVFFCFLFLLWLQVCPSPTEGQRLIFADGFESGDACRWSSTRPESHCDLAPIADLLAGVCVPLRPEGLTGRPPIRVEWDIEADGSIDLVTTVLSRRREEQELEATFCWSPERLGVVPVTMRASNEHGSDKVTVAFRVVDPLSFGACCSPSGTCADVVPEAECSDRWTAGAYCSLIDCQPAPDPVWSPICLFGQCVVETGELITFRTENTHGPYRYDWDAVDGADCGTFGPWLANPVATIEYFAPGAYRPCMEAKDLAGRAFRARSERAIFVIQLD